MKRSIRWGTGPALACLLVFGLVPGVAAAGPTRTTSSQSGSFEVAAGFACDFALRVSYTDTDRFVQFANPSRTVAYLRTRAVYVNLETGYTLFERANQTQTYRADGRARIAGITGQLRDVHGRLVAVSSGRFIASYPISGPVYEKVTPHMNPDFYVRICTALGGHSAGYP